ncbi:MAG: alginate export family protein, partial [Candidatus Omnitrophica bacterium]|nr:alginate export family protein [Candidatus Omnitrophota bacterium]
SLEPISDVVLNGEVAIQTGDFLDTGRSPDSTVDRDAWAFDIGATYDGLSEAIDVLPGLSLRAGYIYRSGQDAVSTTDDLSSTANENRAWDPMYEDQSHGMIANYIFDGMNDGVDSNGRTFTIGASAEPLEDLTVSVDYYFYRLDKKYASDNTAGQLRTLNDLTYNVTDNKDLGNELDVVLDYAYTEDVNMGLACGWFFPGDAFNNKGSSGYPDNNETATQIIASVAVAF